MKLYKKVIYYTALLKWSDIRSYFQIIHLQRTFSSYNVSLLLFLQSQSTKITVIIFVPLIKILQQKITLTSFLSQTVLISADTPTGSHFMPLFPPYQTFVPENSFVFQKTSFAFQSPSLFKFCCICQKFIWIHLLQCDTFFSILEKYDNSALSDNKDELLINVQCIGEGYFICFYIGLDVLVLRAFVYLSLSVKHRASSHMQPPILALL